MKRIYFVRHASTAGNEANAYQLSTIPLSEKGRGQAGALAKRLSKIPFDVLIASDMERAHETARIVGEQAGREVVAEPLFRELRRPSEVHGKSKTDPDVLAVMEQAAQVWEMEGGRYSDEENFHDFKNRALEALAYLRSRPEETLVVVTHGFFLKMLITAMLEGEAMKPEHWARMDDFMFPENTGVSWCEHGNVFHPGGWQLLTWNDHSHLV